MFERPQDLKQLQRFLGMINFYRRFLPQAARTLLPLTAALSGNLPKQLPWDAEKETAFLRAQAVLIATVVLAHPDPAAVLSLATDTSDTHISGVLQQRSGRDWRPLGFFSRKLSPTESRYSTFDRELLGVFADFRHFCLFLRADSSNFGLITSHCFLL